MLYSTFCQAIVTCALNQVTHDNCQTVRSISNSMVEHNELPWFSGIVAGFRAKGLEFKTVKKHRWYSLERAFGI